MNKKKSNLLKPSTPAQPTQTYTRQNIYSVTDTEEKKAPVIPEVKNDDTSYHVSEPVYKRLYTLLRSRRSKVVDFDDFAC